MRQVIKVADRLDQQQIIPISCRYTFNLGRFSIR